MSEITGLARAAMRRVGSSMIRISAFGLVTVGSLASAFGQSVTGETCIKLADSIAAGYVTQMSDRQFDALRYYANCEASKSSSSGGLNIAYEAFSLGGKYDEAKAREICSKSYDTYNIKTSDYNSAKVIFN